MDGHGAIANAFVSNGAPSSKSAQWAPNGTKLLVHVSQMNSTNYLKVFKSSVRSKTTSLRTDHASARTYLLQNFVTRNNISAEYSASAKKIKSSSPNSND